MCLRIGGSGGGVGGGALLGGEHFIIMGKASVTGLAACRDAVLIKQAAHLEL